MTTLLINLWPLYFVFAIAIKQLILMKMVIHAGFYGLGFFTYFIGIPLLLCGLGYFLKLKTRQFLWAIVYTLISLLLMIDAWYFRGFFSLPAFNVVSQVDNLQGLTESVLAMIRTVDLLFVIDLPFIFIMLLVVRRKNTVANRAKFIKAIVVTCIAIILLLYIPLQETTFRGKPFGSDIVISSTIDTAQWRSPLGYHVASFANWLIPPAQMKLNAADVGELQQWLKNKQENIEPSKYFGQYHGQNLIVLQMESVEHFVINRSIYGQEIMPNLNRLIKNSIYFEYFYEQTGQGATSDAEFACNNSLYPLAVGNVFSDHAANKYVSLPYLFKKNGYKVADLHPDSATYWNWLEAEHNNGYGLCMAAGDFDNSDSFNMGMSDESFFRQIVPVIGDMKQPFMVFCITMSSHVPFKIPADRQGLDLTQLGDNPLADYLQAMNYVDRAIAQFFADLDKKGLLDNTVVVMYGDHEGVHRYDGDKLANIKLAGDWWQVNNNRIPLLIFKKNQLGQVVMTTGGQVDILPTICNLMGVPQSEWQNSAFGRDLLNTNRDFALLRSDNLAEKNVIRPLNSTEQWILDGHSWSEKVINANYFGHWLDEQKK